MTDFINTGTSSKVWESHKITGSASATYPSQPQARWAGAHLCRSKSKYITIHNLDATNPIEYKIVIQDITIDDIKHEYPGYSTADAKTIDPTVQPYEWIRIPETCYAIEVFIRSAAGANFAVLGIGHNLAYPLAPIPYVPVVLAIAGRFAKEDIEFEGVRYLDRLLSQPTIAMTLGEFIAGIPAPQTTSFSLENADKGISDWKRTRTFRGKHVTIREYYTSDNSVPETITAYIGVINSMPILGVEAEVNLIPLFTDILTLDFPTEKITTAMFPNAMDTGFTIPFVIGTAKKVPLACVKAYEDADGSQYQYLVGKGDITIDVVYRAGLVLTEYTGNCQSAGANTIKLSASDTHSDHFYEQAFVQVGSEYKLITGYNGTTKDATLDEEWDSVPANGSAYTIREWKKVILTYGGIDYTYIEFAIAQRDSGGSIYNRDSMAADVQGLQTERNPAYAVETILASLNISCNADAVHAAAAEIDEIDGLYVDGALVEQKSLIDTLNEICLIGRIRLTLNSDGEVEPVIDGAVYDVYGPYTSSEIIDVGAPRETGLTDLYKDLSIQYRRQFDTGTYRLTTASRTIASEGRKSLTLASDWIFDKTTADKAACYLARRKASQDSTQSVSFSYEARARKAGDLVRIEYATYVRDYQAGTGSWVNELSGIYQLISESKQNGVYTFDIIPYDAVDFAYVASALPADPYTDARADFSKTPPDAVTSLAVQWVNLILNSYVTARLTFTTPAENFASVIPEYKRTTETLYTPLANVSCLTSTNVTIDIANLTPGISYDFRITSINAFNLTGGSATLANQVAPGDTVAPAVPNGGVRPSGKVEFRTFTFWIDTASDEDDFLEYVWDVVNASTNNSMSGFPQHTRSTSVTYTDSGTATVSVKAHLKAVDFSKRSSAYTPYSLTYTTATLNQGDITNHEITGKSTYSNSGTVSLSQGQWNTIGSVTRTTRGEMVFVWIKFTFAVASGGSQSGASWRLYMDSTSNVIDEGETGWANPNEGRDVSSNSFNVPSAGSHTYTLQVFCAVSNQQVRNRTITLAEWLR